MMRQSEFKRKYDPEMRKYTKQHIYGEGIMDSVKSFFKKPTPKSSMHKTSTYTTSTSQKSDISAELICRQKGG